MPNGAMIYLIYSDNLELHPSFRNLPVAIKGDVENGSFRKLDSDNDD